MIGVDLGGTFTKVCITNDNGANSYEIFPTSMEKLKEFFVMKDNHLVIPSENLKIRKWRITGGGAYKFRSFFDTFNPQPEFVDELSATAKGSAHLLSNPDNIKVIGNNKITSKFLMISMGTGVSFTIVEPGKERRHIGGSALGGGTVMGLSKLLLQVTSFDTLLELASRGSESNLDLLLSDVYGEDYGALTANVCASSLGKIATQEVNVVKEDLAASLISTICYSIGCQAASICTGSDIKTIVFVGGFLSQEGIIPNSLQKASLLYQKDLTIVIPNNAQFVGALGATLL